MNASPETLNILFPVPSRAPKSFGLAPSRIPGPNAKSVEALREYLKDNHRKRHIFFNDMGFHNHATHHLLAIYALGADAKLLNAAYQTHIIYQRPSFPSPGEITTANWKTHLGDETYYQAYAAFFTELLLKEGPGAVVERYVFSKDVNIGSENRINMVGRFLGGFLHPLIHAGYGAEFGQLGMWAEGLAEACAEQLPVPPVALPESLFESGGLTDKLASLKLSEADGGNGSPHALTILARIRADPAFTPAALGLPIAPQGDFLAKILAPVGDKLASIVNEWSIETTHEDLEKKLEEVIWMNSVIYAVAGYGGRHVDPKKEFNADFFFMHLVTSVLFLPSLMAYLTPASSAILLKTYLTSSLIVYIAAGAPALPIAEFFTDTTDSPVQPGVQPTPTNKFARGPGASGVTDQHETVWEEVSSIVTPNPWLPIIQTTLVHPNEHLCKLQRALAHFGAELGETPAGTFAHLVDSGLKGAETLDGTLFVRAAGLTANKLGWIREGQDMRLWDFAGFLN
ncbi:hypothetical protein QCA50_015057 [Cerrena zonata]|uniref:Oxidoreductase AflY n=1 Tax=Cerrena zonata TaxID=2478898 RepID=A0AAW0FS11_9APHY